MGLVLVRGYLVSVQILSPRFVLLSYCGIIHYISVLVPVLPFIGFLLLLFQIGFINRSFASQA